MSQPTMNNAAAQDGWLYIGKLAVLAFSILLCLVTLKFFTEHRLAPKNSGLGGALDQPKLDLLLIGSSHTRKSYDMRLLERETGLSASFLITYDGADPSTISQILDYLVTNPDHCPRYLVIEAYSAFLARKSDLQDPRFFFDAPPPLKMSIIRSYLSEKNDWSAYLDIFDLVVNRGSDVIVAYPLSSPIVENGSYKGGRKDFFFPGLSPDEFRNLKAQTIGSVPDPAQILAVDHIIKVSRSHNIEVIFIDPPMPLPVTSNSDIQTLKENYREFLAAQHVPYIDGDQIFPIDNPALFSDSNHLSSQGRENFTLRISADLRAWMASHPAAVR